MKNTYKILAVILLLLASVQVVVAQRAFYFSPDATVNVNDSVVIRLNDYEGTIQWQKSLDLDFWQNIPGAIHDTLLFVADTTTYFRAKVIAGDCDPFYSDTTMVGVFHIFTSSVTEITDVSAVTGGIVISDGGAPVTARGVVWSTTPKPTIENNEGYTTDGSGLGEFTSTLTGLTPETTYYVRAYATNSQGTGYGQQEDFTTDENDGGNIQPGEGVTDIDGNFYPSVIIGNQEWMAENLRVSRDANGNDITRYCYDNDAANCNLYGGLYTWHTVMNGAGSSNTNPSNVQGICPTGWHLPSDAEWTELVDYVVAQGYPNSNVVNGAGNALKSCRQVSSPLEGDCATSEHPRWNSHSTHYGTDEFGFSALPGGARVANGNYYYLGLTGSWWSSTEYSTTTAWYRLLYDSLGFVHRGDNYKGRGFSVRCVRDNLRTEAE